MTELASSSFLDLLKLERRSDDSYSWHLTGGHLYGGQLLAQALAAAASTVSRTRLPHSLQTSFVRSAFDDGEISLVVVRDRDGRSFSHRRVLVTGREGVIFSMTALFHRPIAAQSWAATAPPDDDPDELSGTAYLPLWDATLEMRVLAPVVPYSADEMPIPAQLWVRTKDPLPDEGLLHACALAYVSDLGSGFGDGTVEGFRRNGPTLAQSLWFHEPIRLDEWTRLNLKPAMAMGTCGLYTGHIWDGKRRLGATLNQSLLLNR
jgi:acyl-CoA thioesterase-2